MECHKCYRMLLGISSNWNDGDFRVTLSRDCSLASLFSS